MANYTYDEIQNNQILDGQMIKYGHKCDIRLSWWQDFWISTIFLWQRWPFGLLNEGREYGLLVSSWVQVHARDSHTCHFVLPYLQDNGLLRSKSFATMATWHNDFSYRPYSRYLTSLHVFKGWWDKSNVTWFLEGKQVKKIAIIWKKSRLSLFIPDNRKWKPFHLKYNNVKIWVEVIIVPYLYTVGTTDVLMANSNDENLAKTQYECFQLLLNRRLVFKEWTNSTAITCIGKFYHWFAPWNTTWHSFYPIDPRARAKLTGIVIKVEGLFCWLPPTSFSIFYSQCPLQIFHRGFIVMSSSKQFSATLSLSKN